MVSIRCLVHSKCSENGSYKHYSTASNYSTDSNPGSEVIYLPSPSLVSASLSGSETPAPPLWAWNSPQLDQWEDVSAGPGRMPFVGPPWALLLSMFH